MQLISVLALTSRSDGEELQKLSLQGAEFVIGTNFIKKIQNDHDYL